MRKLAVLNIGQNLGPVRLDARIRTARSVSRELHPVEVRNIRLQYTATGKIAVINSDLLT